MRTDVPPPGTGQPGKEAEEPPNRAAAARRWALQASGGGGCSLGWRCGRWKRRAAGLPAHLWLQTVKGGRDSEVSSTETWKAVVSEGLFQHRCSGPNVEADGPMRPF